MYEEQRMRDLEAHYYARSQREAAQCEQQRKEDQKQALLVVEQPKPDVNPNKKYLLFIAHERYPRWLSRGELMTLLEDPSVWGIHEFINVDQASSSDGCPEFWMTGQALLLDLANSVLQPKPKQKAWSL